MGRLKSAPFIFSLFNFIIFDKMIKLNLTLILLMVKMKITNYKVVL